MTKGLTVTLDQVSDVMGALNELVSKQVLIGIPESEADRDSDGPITNAALGYIHEHGAPEANIPARPSLVPGVQDAQERATEYMKKAAKAALDGDQRKADVYLNDAGIVGQNGVRRRINSGDFVPLKPSTVRNRRRSRGTKSMRDSEKKYLELIADGTSPANAQAQAGILPLVNTAQFRNSITYVVRKK